MQTLKFGGSTCFWSHPSVSRDKNCDVIPDDDASIFQRSLDLTLKSHSVCSGKGNRHVVNFQVLTICCERINRQQALLAVDRPSNLSIMRRYSSSFPLSFNRIDGRIKECAV